MDMHSQMHQDVQSGLQPEMQPEMQPQIQHQIQHQIQPEMHSQMQPQMQPQMYNQTQPEMHSQMEGQMQAQTGNSIQAQTENPVQSQLGGQAHSQMGNPAYSQLEGQQSQPGNQFQSHSQLGQTHSLVGNQMSPQPEGQHSQMGGQMYPQMDSQTHSQPISQTPLQSEGQHPQIANQAHSQMEGQFTQTGSQMHSQMESQHPQTRNQMPSQLEAHHSQTVAETHSQMEPPAPPQAQHQMQSHYQAPMQPEIQQQIHPRTPSEPMVGMASTNHGGERHIDQAMEVDDSANTTITANSAAPLPSFAQQNTNSHTPEAHRPSTSYSDTAYQYTTHNGSRFNTPSDADTPPRPNYYDGNRDTCMGQSHSRPSSQIGRYPSSESGGRSNSYQDQQRAAQQQQETAAKNASVVIKVGMVGDAQIGKTSLMVKYVEGSWDEDYIQTLGVNFMEKTISIRNTEITFSIWDLGGQREFVNMLPLVCNDAVAILFMFDLTRKSTLNSIKEWYRQGRGFNKTAIPFLVGTKYDHFVNFPREEQEEISNQAKRFARAMKASLIFSSTSHSINVQKIFKIVLSKAFDLKCTIPEIEHIGEPLLLYQAV